MPSLRIEGEQLRPRRREVCPPYIRGGKLAVPNRERLSAEGRS